MTEKIVISASRTRDMVRCSPGLLAGILRGEAPARLSRWSPPLRLSPQEIGAVVLWTKHPANISAMPALHRVVRDYRDAMGIAVVLNLTVTGLGGSVLEPGIPAPEEVFAALEELVASGSIDPDAVIMRYDPLIKVEGAKRAGNVDPALFERLAVRFAGLGVKRVKTSEVDYSYRHVPKRLEAINLTPLIADKDEIDDMIESMKEICSTIGMRLDICCNPWRFAGAGTRGCIDGKMINRLLAGNGATWRVTEILHNDLGRQRESCACTYSKDIGYSPGVKTCFPTGDACLYCYSQRNMSGPAIDEARSLAGAESPRREEPERPDPA